VLQAADILLYDADEVPVGEDQKQHVELARDIALRFNHLYGDTFTVPEPRVPTTGARIMGLDDPTAKMSKSSTGAKGHAILLTDSDADIEVAIRRAVTDSGREVAWSDDPARAGVNNLLTIYSAVTGRDREQTTRDFGSARGYGDLKRRVAEVVVEAIRPIRERFAQLTADHGELERLLRIGADAARAVSEPKVLEIKRRIGLLPAD
jgi:tryptophanyl-tRNA synthetase